MRARSISALCRKVPHFRMSRVFDNLGFVLILERFHSWNAARIICGCYCWVCEKWEIAKFITGNLCSEKDGQHHRGAYSSEQSQQHRRHCDLSCLLISITKKQVWIWTSCAGIFFRLEEVLALVSFSRSSSFRSDFDQSFHNVAISTERYFGEFRDRW
jgi:hypothetical protein